MLIWQLSQYNNKLVSNEVLITTRAIIQYREKHNGLLTNPTETPTTVTFSFSCVKLPLIYPGNLGVISVVSSHLDNSNTTITSHTIIPFSSPQSFKILEGGTNFYPGALKCSGTYRAFVICHILRTLLKTTQMYIITTRENVYV